MFITHKSLKFRNSLTGQSLFNQTLSQPSKNTQVYLHSTLKYNEKKSHNNLKLPEEPQNCCMSGCANCVWVAYAKELCKILDDEGETAKEKIMEHVKDPNLRAFLMLELSFIFNKKKK